MTQTAAEADSRLAINGGPKAFAGRTRPFRPQLGIEEFFALAERYGLKPQAPIADPCGT